MQTTYTNNCREATRVSNARLDPIPRWSKLTASALERLGRTVLLTEVHETGHLVLGDNHLLATPGSEGATCR